MKYKAKMRFRGRINEDIYEIAEIKQEKDVILLKTVNTWTPTDFRIRYSVADFERQLKLKNLLPLESNIEVEKSQNEFMVLRKGMKLKNKKEVVYEISEIPEDSGMIMARITNDDRMSSDYVVGFHKKTLMEFIQSGDLSIHEDVQESIKAPEQVIAYQCPACGEIYLKKASAVHCCDIRTCQAWLCGVCGNLYNSLDEAEACCAYQP